MSGSWVLRILGYLFFMAALWVLLDVLGILPRGDMLAWWQERRSHLRAWQLPEPGAWREALARWSQPIGAALRRASPAERFRRMSELEGYDPEHARRLGQLARRLAEAAGLDPAACDGVEEAAWWHDMGEAELCEVLARPEPLAPEERVRLHEHPLRGAELAAHYGRNPDAPWWVRWHHERVDGMGYPDGLFGEEIPLPARILAIADAFEALTHDRPYRAALELQEAAHELSQLAGMQHDAQLWALFVAQVIPEAAGNRPS